MSYFSAGRKRGNLEVKGFMPGSRENPLRIGL